MACGNSSCSCFSSYASKTWIVKYKHSESDEDEIIHYFEMINSTCVEEAERVYREMWPDRIVISFNEKT